MVVAVMPKTTLVIISVELDEADEDMLTGLLVGREGAENNDSTIYQVMKRLKTECCYRSNCFVVRVSHLIGILSCGLRCSPTELALDL